MSKIPKSAVHTRDLIDREGQFPWPAGQWDNEADLITWDYSPELRCEIKRNTTGNLCGYVVIHSTHGMHPSRTTLGWEYGNYYDINVHGGWTYSNGRELTTTDVMKASLGESGAVQPDFVIGFDCAHLNDLVPGMIAVNRSFGSMSYDGGSYKDIEYVAGEVINACEAFDKLARGEEL